MKRLHLKHFSTNHTVLKLPYLLIALLVAVVIYQTVHLLTIKPVQQGTVRLQTSRLQYEAGDTVSYTISNETAQTVYVTNNCPGEPLEVSMKGSDGWKQIHASVETASKCLDEPRSYTITPGAKVTSSYSFWKELFEKPGHYRIQAPIEGLSNEPSAEFDVID